MQEKKRCIFDLKKIYIFIDNYSGKISEKASDVLNKENETLIQLIKIF